MSFRLAATHVTIALLLFTLPTATMFGQVNQPNGPIEDTIGNQGQRKSERGEIDGLTSDERAAVAQISQIATTAGTTEWLGAMAPVALSPFFGLTCLSGIAIAGDDYLPADHFLRQPSSPLRQPIVFITFLVLTIVTSIPKFSKVSKPFAQAVDQLEAYSAIIVLLVIRYMGSGFVDEQQVAIVYKAGMFEFSAEMVIWIATILNILIINTVKFFFEVLVWITPVPFLDAVFEAANKCLCAVLMAIYAFSPVLATALNLLILLVCAFAFRWIKRREVYFRTILFDLLRDMLNRRKNIAPNATLTVFPMDAMNQIPALARCDLTPQGEGWQLRCGRLFRKPIVQAIQPAEATIKRGLLANVLIIGNHPFKFSRRHNRQLEELCTKLRAELSEIDDEQRTSGQSLAGDLAAQ